MTENPMPPSNSPTIAKETTKTEAEKRQDRLAQALRDNLRRRKAQKRGRADGEPSASKKGSDHG